MAVAQKYSCALAEVCTLDRFVYDIIKKKSEEAETKSSIAAVLILRSLGF